MSSAEWPVCTCGELARLVDGYFLCRNRVCPDFGQVLRSATAREQAEACAVSSCGLPALHPVHERAAWHQTPDARPT